MASYTSRIFRLDFSAVSSIATVCENLAAGSEPKRRWDYDAENKLPANVKFRERSEGGKVKWRKKVAKRAEHLRTFRHIEA